MISFKTLRSLCIDLIIFFIPLALIWVSSPFIFSVLSPFIAGYILYLVANPLNRRLKKVLPDGISAFLSLAVISAVVFYLFTLLFTNLLEEIVSLTQPDSALYNETLPFISKKFTQISTRGMESGFLTTLLDTIESHFAEFLTRLGTGLINYLKSVPSMVISTFATVFTTFFLLKDDVIIRKYLCDFFGEKIVLRFGEMKNSFLDVTLSYLKAQLIVGVIIFAVLLGGFFWLDVPYALLLALFTAILDAVPLLGTGIVLIPMSVFSFLTGDMSLGWSLLILFGVSMLARQLCEPKIIGQKLGIHPLLTIFSLYAGMKLFGIIGVFLGPVGAIFIKNLICSQKEKVRA